MRPTFGRDLSIALVGSLITLLTTGIYLTAGRRELAASRLALEATQDTLMHLKTTLAEVRTTYEHLPTQIHDWMQNDLKALASSERIATVYVRCKP